jgi:hypothetical protein
MAEEVYDTDAHRERFGVPSDDERVIVCHECGERLDASVFHLPIKPDEVAVLRFALDPALSSTSEAHPKNRAQLQALIERLDAGDGSVVNATEPTPVLRDDEIYLGDNGRCGRLQHAGMTAHYTGRELSGQRVHRVTEADQREARHMGVTLACEGCRR